MSYPVPERITSGLYSLRAMVVREKEHETQKIKKGAKLSNNGKLQLTS